MSQAVSPIALLPEELMVLILNYLDSRAPSEIKGRHEPTQDVAVCSVQPLKKLSLVSRRWRRVALPLLFKYTRLRFYPPGTSQRLSCAICETETVKSGPEPVDAAAQLPPSGRPAEQCAWLLQDFDRYHLDITRDAILETNIARENRTVKCPEEYDHYESMLMWPSIIYHSVRQFLRFLTRERLQKGVESLIILSEPMSLEKLDLYPNLMTQASKWRSTAIAALWQHLFAYINPARIAILAPPIELACFTSCAIDTFGDWAFGDMDYHFLELRQTCQSEQVQSIDQLDYRSLSFKPLHYPGIGGSSVLRLRIWSHVSLNEASFLKAYGTYNFFERGPPSLVYSINDSLFVRKSTTDLIVPPLASIETFTYTAILPFCTHLDFQPLLSCIVTIDLQLAPLPDSDILTDRLRVGRAELDDCWSELFSTYENLVRRIATFSISAESCPRLQKFICRDMQIKGLQGELDQIFIGLCMPVWAEFEPGVFTRLAKSAAAVMQDAA